MTPSSPIGRARRLVPLAAAALFLPACKSSYSADLRNQTPVPLYAQIVERTDRGARLHATERLGPGDRRAVGPVRVRTGRAILVVDSKPNPNAPTAIDMTPGAMILEVTQEATEPVRPEGKTLRIREIH